MDSRGKQMAVVPQIGVWKATKPWLCYVSAHLDSGSALLHVITGDDYLYCHIISCPHVKSLSLYILH